MNHEAITNGDAHVRGQIEAVPAQSAAYREVDAKIRTAAGWREAWHPENKSENACWLRGEPLPLKIRIKATGAVLEIGYEHARERVLSGVATLVDG
jgi:hypothetical protein